MRTALYWKNRYIKIAVNKQKSQANFELFRKNRLTFHSLNVIITELSRTDRVFEVQTIRFATLDGETG